MDAMDDEVLFVGTAEAEHTEMYLKAIWHIREKGDDVKISTIAKRLNVRQPSGVQMLKKLSERELVTYNKAGVTLKESGEKVASSMIRNSRLLEVLMESSLKIEIDEEDLVTQIFSRISDSVTWRKTSQLIGTGVEAIVARAEDNLIQGDLESAINELESLEPKAKLILGDWLQAAKKHITANKAVSSLQNIAISQLVNVER